MDDSKHAMRRAMRAARAAIPDRVERSHALRGEVLAWLRDRPGTTVLAFVGVGSEPTTDALLDDLRRAGHAVLLPRVEGDEMVAVAVDAGAELVAGAFGIPAPAGQAVDPTGIDVVLVPGLAFTADGRRLGQGGGFYDRFLTHLSPACELVGVAFREQLVDDLPTEPHDRKVGAVITDPVPE